MARKQRTPPGFIGLRANYEAALSEYTAAVMMLEQWVQMVVKPDLDIPGLKIPEPLRERGAAYLQALEEAKYRDGD